MVADAEERLCEELQWAGLQWDEGPQVGGPFGPYKQSERNHIYQKHAKNLIDSGSAYRCFCTTQTSGLNGGKAAYVTSGCYKDCSSLPADESEERASSKKTPRAFTIRLKEPEDARKRVYKDLIYGKIQRLKRSPGGSTAGDDASGIDAADTILVKSDGTPTYHFANVVDDHLMQITHVIRGTEWMASTPLHYDLYTAFGWTPPTFAHVGLLVDENKAKLSKRSSSGLVLDVRGMRDQEHILPPVLCNFLSLLGWSNPGRNDVMDMRDLIREFDLKFTKGNTIVRTEKLWFLQKAHVARLCEEAPSMPAAESAIDEIVEAIVPYSKSHSLRSNPGSQKAPPKNDDLLRLYCKQILLSDSKSYQTPEQFVQRNEYFFNFDVEKIPKDVEFYDKQRRLTARDLWSLTQDVVQSEEFQNAFVAPPITPNLASSDTGFSKVSAAALVDDMRKSSHLIHRAVNKAVWQRLVSEKCISAVDEAALDNPKTFLQSLAPDGLAEYNEGALLMEYKNWNAAMMRFLREKLSYGWPGPAMGQIIAILGRRECEDRFAAQEGWRSIL